MNRTFLSLQNDTEINYFDEHDEGVLILEPFI